MRAAYDGFMADDCVYESSGLPTCHDRKETMDFFFEGSRLNEATGQEYLGGIVRLVVDLENIAAAGELVFTERTDHHYDAEGKDVLTPRIAGVMVLRDGKLVRWSDYFDTVHFRAGASRPASR